MCVRALLPPAAVWCRAPCVLFSLRCAARRRPPMFARRSRVLLQRQPVWLCASVYASVCVHTSSLLLLPSETACDSHTTAPPHCSQTQSLVRACPCGASPSPILCCVHKRNGDTNSHLRDNNSPHLCQPHTRHSTIYCCARVACWCVFTLPQPPLLRCGNAW